MAGTDTVDGQAAPVRCRRLYGMRERLSFYFLLAVLLPLAVGTAISEYLIERRIVGLARSNAEERLESITSHLDERARVMQLALVQLASTPGLAGALADREAANLSAMLNAGKTHRDLDFLVVIG